MDYETGMFIDFLIGIFLFTQAFTKKRSILAKNLKKISLYFNPWKNDFSSHEEPSLTFYGILYLVLSPILSWFSVLSFIIGNAVIFFNKPPVPENVKKALFTLSSFEMNRADVDALCSGIFFDIADDIDKNEKRKANLFFPPVIS